MSLVGCGSEQKATDFWVRVMFTLKISYVGISDMTQSSDLYQELCVHTTLVDVKSVGAKIEMTFSKEKPSPALAMALGKTACHISLGTGPLHLSILLLRPVCGADRYFITAED